MEEATNIGNRENNGADRVPPRATWLPGWVADTPAVVNDDDERSVLAWEAALTPTEAAAADAAIEEFDEWICRVGADGRVGYDRPGTRVESRWWEWTTFDDLPDLPDAVKGATPKDPAEATPPADQSKPRKRARNRGTRSSILFE